MPGGGKGLATAVGGRGVVVIELCSEEGVDNDNGDVDDTVDGDALVMEPIVVEGGRGGGGTVLGEMLPTDCVVVVD